jgi:hypothetical protein
MAWSWRSATSFGASSWTAFTLPKCPTRRRVAFVHAVLAQTSRADTIDHAFGAVPQVRGSFTPGRRGFPEPALLG